jgi:hypothetical protein
MPDSPWISVKDSLPKEGKYVLGRHNRDTWHDNADQYGVNFVVVSLVKGISRKERSRMKPTQKRRQTYMHSDEWANNLVPYAWSTFGPDSFFGQEIEYWMPIPEIPHAR